MKSKSPKNKIPVPSSEKSFTTTEVGAMIESFDEKLTLIAEDVSGLHQKFDLMAIEISQIKSRLDIIEMRVGKLGKDMSEVKSEVKAIRRDLEGKVDHKEFSALERRVSVLEARTR